MRTAVVAVSLLIASVYKSSGQSATPLAELITEAERNNPGIVAADHTWQAATQVHQQVTTLPDPQFTVQEFSVGSPKPFCRFHHE